MVAPPKVPALIHVPDDVSLYLNSYQEAPVEVQVVVTLVALTVVAANVGGKAHPLSAVVVNVTLPQVPGCEFDAQYDRTSTSYDVDADKPVNNFDVAVPPKVPALIHVPDELSLYLISNQPAPATLGHVMVALLALMVLAVKLGANAHAGEVVVKITPDDQGPSD